MTLTFDMWTVLLAVAVSVVGLLLKPLFKDRKVRGIPLTKFLPYVLTAVSLCLSLLMGDVNPASAMVRGLTSAGLATLGYDGVRALLYRKES